MMVMTTGIIHTLLLGLLIIESVYAIAGMFKFFGRASPVSPSSSDTDDNGYYERFPLDYGCDDNIRIAGSMKGFIRTGRLSGLHESDPFFKWLNEKLEKGPEVPSNRVKPYYAADFGSSKDLKNGENPKVVIVNRLLRADQKGVLLNSPKDVDVEVREVWQPWLKSKCDFVVRYIVPNRSSIIELMEAQGRFRSELRVDKSDNGKNEAYAVMTFKPTLLDRIKGKKDVAIRRKMDYSKLF